MNLYINYNVTYLLRCEIVPITTFYFTNLIIAVKLPILNLITIYVKILFIFAWTTMHVIILHSHTPGI